MRLTAVVCLAWISFGSACFEDAPPVDDDETSPSTSADCMPGTEGCPCIDGACVGGLMCLSQVCVDANATGDPMTSGSGSNGTDAGMTASGDTTAGPAETGPAEDTTDGPAETGNGGSIPQGGACDPLDDMCEVGTACIGPGGDSVICLAPGTLGEGDPCRVLDCGPGLYCAPAETFSMCAGTGCCTPFCSVSDRESCPPGWTCTHYFSAPYPTGYEDLGVCLEIP